jgi:exopolysaccharide biosynthesis polyprenyl glycosylphosphotransferase
MLKRRPAVRRRGWIVRRALLTADTLGLVGAFLAAEWLARVGGAAGSLDATGEMLAFVVTLPVWILVAKLHGLYERDEERLDHSTTGDFSAVFHMVTLCTWLVAVGSRVTGLFAPTAAKLVVFWALAIGFVTLGRMCARAVSRRRPAYLQNTIVVGAGEVGQLVARKLEQHPEYRLNLVGFVDSSPKERRPDLRHLPLLGEMDRLPALVRAHGVERVIFAFSNDHHEETIELIRALRGLRVQVDVVPRLFEVLGPNIGLHGVEGLPLIALPPARHSRPSRALKRALDLVGAVVGLLVASPLFAYAAWRIKRESPGPVLFRQPRLGFGMREFEVLKFRTMRADTDDAPHRAYIQRTMSAAATPNGNGIYKLDRSDAVTPFGRWLRRTSLDELPQLINVLRGEMSLVGPRPCIRYETESFAPHHFERFRVPAGITGLWQVTARAHATFGEALDMDVRYARGWSLRLDVELLCKTPLQLVRPRGTA